MTETSELEGMEFRVILIDPESRRWVTSGRPHKLVRVSIPRKTRYVRQVQLALQRTLGIAALVVEFLSIHEDGSSCVVAELLRTVPSAEFREVAPNEIPDEELSEGERVRLSRLLEDNPVDSVSSIGWIDQAIQWVQDALGATCHSKVGIEQYGAGGGFALVRLSCRDGQSYWLKATAAPNAHERTLTRFLSQRCEPWLPNIVAERPEWNAWIMTGGASALPEIPTEPAKCELLLKCAANSLAELQKRTAGYEEQLLCAGAVDQRFHIMQTHVDTLFSHIGEALSSPLLEKVRPIEPARLRELQRILTRVYQHMERLNFPVTVLHGDLNLGNILFAQGTCQFTDWSEGFIGFPFITLEHLLLLNQLKCPHLKASVSQTVRNSYCSAISDICDRRAIQEGMACAPLVAAVSALYGRGDWLYGAARIEPHRLRYTRMMIRHIDLAAQHPALLNTVGA